MTSVFMNAVGRRGVRAAGVAGSVGLTLWWVQASVGAAALAASLPLAPVYALGLAAGGAAGFLFGLLGIGGALVVMPALYLMLPALGVAPADLPHVAVATSLTVMLPGALRGTWIQLRGGGLDRRWVTRLAPGIVVGAAAGAVLALQVHGPTLSLLFVAQSVYYGCGLLRAGPARETGFRARLAARCRSLPAWAVGPLGGGFCACIGMGGGSLFVPYLLTHGVSLLRASATSGAFNLAIAAGGAVGFVATQASADGGATVHWPAALAIAAAALLAVPFGVAAGPRFPPVAFRRVLAGINLLGAAVLLVRTVWP